MTLGELKIGDSFKFAKGNLTYTVIGFDDGFVIYANSWRGTYKSRNYKYKVIILRYGT